MKLKLCCVLRCVRNKILESNIKIKLKNALLEVLLNEIEYLGVIIDKNLNFTVHVNYLGKKIGSKLWVLRRISANLILYL